MPETPLTSKEHAELRMWQSVLDDRTRPVADHDAAKAAIERLNVQGPWVLLRELGHRVRALEGAVDLLADKIGLVNFNTLPPTVRAAGKLPKSQKKSPPKCAVKPAAKPVDDVDQLPF